MIPKWPQTWSRMALFRVHMSFLFVSAVPGSLKTVASKYLVRVLLVKERVFVSISLLYSKECSIRIDSRRLCFIEFSLFWLSWHSSYLQHCNYQTQTSRYLIICISRVGVYSFVTRSNKSWLSPQCWIKFAGEIQGAWKSAEIKKKNERKREKIFGKLL